MNNVCVIIPCYRDAATLGRALNSVYAQTAVIHEVIVVNDCSPETEQIESVLQQHPNVVYVKNETNVGLAATRNHGVAISTGNIVSFLDADDELHPQKIELQLKVLSPGVLVACGLVRVRHVQSEIIVRFNSVGNVVEYNSPEQIIVANRVTGASLLAFKDDFLTLLGFESSLKSCEDFDFWLRALGSGYKIYKIKLPLYFYYINPLGLSSNFLAISEWELKVIRRYFSRSGKSKAKTLSDALVWSFWLLRHLVRLGASNHPEQLRGKIRENLDFLSDFRWIKFSILCLIKLRVLEIFSAFYKWRWF